MTFFVAVYLADAKPAPFDFKSITCKQVQEFVGSHGGQDAAAEVARQHGAPKWFIRWATRCLKK